MLRILPLACLLAASAFGQTRPRDPFVFRTAINEGGNDPTNNKNRLVAVLLNANFLALYSTENGGSLYMTRTGSTQDGNSTYGHNTFGQVLQFSGGAVMHRNTTAQLWDLLVGGTPATNRTAVYKGFTLNGNMVSLRYEVVSGTTTVRIAETPEYAAGGNGKLVRTLAVTGLGANQSLRLRLSGPVSPETWTVTGAGTVSGTNPVYLTMTADGTATLTGSW